VPEQNTEQPKKPNMSEFATLKNNPHMRYWVGDTQMNPDYILRRKAVGKSYQLYSEMEYKDPHIGSLIQTRKNGVLSKPWEILPGSEEARDQEIAEFVNAVIWKIPYFDRDIRELLDAIPKGIAVSEVMWERRPDGRIGIEDIRSRDPRRFAFDLEGALRLKTKDAMTEGIAVPERKFLVHTFDPAYENPYGEAVLKKCWWYYWFKNNGIKFWAIFIEKFGSPTPVGKYPPGATEEQQNKLLEIIRTMQQETGVVIPDGTLIEFLEAQRKGSFDCYRGFCDYMDSRISQAILGQTLTSSEGQHGTQALGTVHQEVRQDYVEADCKSVMPVINELIHWLVDFNFTNVEYYPEFIIRYEPEEDTKALAETDLILTKELGLPLTQDYFYDRYGRPRPDEGQDLLVVPSGAAMPFPEFSARRNPPLSPFSKGGDKGGSVSKGEDGGMSVFTGGTFDAQGRYLDDTEELFEAASDQAGDMFDARAGQALEPFAKKKEGDPVTADMRKLIDTITLDQKPLAHLLRDTLIVAFLMASVHFWTEHEEVLKEIQGMSVGATRWVALNKQSSFAETSFEPMPPKEAIDFFKKLIPLDPERAKEVGKKLEEYGFRIAGLEDARILELVKAGLDDALEEGSTVGEFRKKVNALFDAEGITRLSAHHIDNVFRTNLHTAYSAGAYERMHDPETAGYFPYFEYITAGDESVRPSHAKMHKHVAPRDDSIWQTWWPPNGYRCRCRVRAINKYEVKRRNVRPSENLGLMPDPGFEGTPMQQLGLAA